MILCYLNVNVQSIIAFNLNYLSSLQVFVNYPISCQSMLVTVIYNSHRKFYSLCRLKTIRYMPNRFIFLFKELFNKLMI